MKIEAGGRTIPTSTLVMPVGCIAARPTWLLLREPIQQIDQGIATGTTTRHDLPTPVPVFVVYETAFVDTVGTLQFRPDFYDRDPAIWRALETRPRVDDVVAVTDRRQKEGLLF